ncbi:MULTISPECIES: hypothetical protein [Ralstonia]|jgi:hypothetical protein|uniref:Uncharacterized protein n=2 Tax=Ralstonia pickettii TaxID=329 RepID=R0DWB9_RALPI|nr:hypothetical protein [Ralstonia pickettii]ENZ77708.1 hypothetical protein OR214_01984 [Ralstonia pickettii OR214]MCM3583891.1 hypothetical protein [Ralstonia pickettii]
MTLSQSTFPLYVRCALETFASHGERTKARLKDLLDFFFRSTGQSQSDERTSIETVALEYAKQRWQLGALEGF